MGLLLLAGPLSAQDPVPKPPTMEEAMRAGEAASRMMNPAANVLAHREELGLTADQASRLQPIADRMARAIDALQAVPRPVQERMAQAMVDTTIVVDENALRAELCDQAAQQASFMMAMFESQRALARILTPAQRQKFQELWLAESMRMMQ